MTLAEIEILKAGDPAIFAEIELSIELDPWQKRFVRHEGKDLIILATRHGGKSTAAAIKALHKGIYVSGSLSLVLSPSLRQSKELFRKVITFLHVSKNMPETVEESKQFLTLKNGSRVVSLPAKEGTVRGYSDPDLIIEDEAAEVPDELYYAVRPMLILGKGIIILISTGKGKRGHFYYEYSSGGDAFERITITALECPRISKAKLEHERNRMGESYFRQEYMCSFEENVDHVFSIERIRELFTDEVKSFTDPLSKEIKSFC